MPEKKESPYLCHVFVCTNDRKGVRQSCADGNSPQTRATLKAAVAAKGWKPRVRVSMCGCMGLCTEGPNVLLYPQKTWFAGVTPNDVDTVMAEIGKLLEAAAG
jgi:(2Fe-2S) ferredoxin